MAEPKYAAYSPRDAKRHARRYAQRRPGLHTVLWKHPRHTQAKHMRNTLKPYHIHMQSCNTGVVRSPVAPKSSTRPVYNTRTGLLLQLYTMLYVAKSHPSQAHGQHITHALASFCCHIPCYITQTLASFICCCCRIIPAVKRNNTIHTIYIIYPVLLILYKLLSRICTVAVY